MRREKRNKFTLIASLILVVSTGSFAEVGSLGRQEASRLEGIGRIVGRVRLEGSFKRPALLKVYKNRAFCGAEVPNESLLLGPEGGVQNVVITIPGVRHAAAKSKVENIALDNKKCAFVPHVQVAPPGSEILLLNSDPILHDVHARLGSETLFNVGLPTWRQVKTRLTRPGTIKIECEVLHTWMSAYIVVTSSPYFAVTNEKGEFSIDGIPPGTYEMQVWHERLGRQLKKVVVKENGTSKVSIAFP